MSHKDPGFGPVDTTQSPYARWKALEFKSVSLSKGFWARKLAVNRETSL
jgi:hypothetical protein